MTEAAIRRLRRRPADGKIAGVCAGLAVYFDVDVVLVRGAWVILSIWPGAIVLGIVAYLAAWVLMPRTDGPAPAASRPRLVRDGMARVSARRRLSRWDELRSAELEAQQRRRGRWGDTPRVPPETYRLRRRR